MSDRLFIVFVLVVISISMSACQSNNKEVIQNSENSENSVEYNALEVASSDRELFNDLVYREYLGEKFHVGEVVISKETFLSATENPESVIVYFNDEILETIDYKDADIQIDLTNEGIYRFMIVDKDSEVVDITSQVQGVSYPEGGVTYLK